MPAACQASHSHAKQKEEKSASVRKADAFPEIHIRVTVYKADWEVIFQVACVAILNTIRVQLGSKQGKVLSSRHIATSCIDPLFLFRFNE